MTIAIAPVSASAPATQLAATPASPAPRWRAKRAASAARRRPKPSLRPANASPTALYNPSTPSAPTGTVILAGRRSPHRGESLTEYILDVRSGRVRRRDRRHAADRSAQAVGGGRPDDPGQGGVSQSGRLGEGSRGARHHP